MRIDITALPFSRFGSAMALNVVPKSWNCPGLLLRTMHGVFASREVFVLDPVRDGKVVPYTITTTPTKLRMTADGGWVEFCYADADLLRLRGRGLALRISSIGQNDHYAFPGPGGAAHVNCPANCTQYMLTPLRGELHVDAPHIVHAQDSRKRQRPPRFPRVIVEFRLDERGGFEGAIEEFLTTPARPDLSPTFDECLGDVEAEWAAWLETMPALPARYVAAAELAMYVNWMSVIAPIDQFTRPTMLMSKNWMTQCWSWDHCFNAMALSYRNPDLAWDQWMVLFDHQDPDGCLPDSVSSPRRTWNFCKPPVHGWALSKMMKERGLLTDERAATAFAVLGPWTDWWMGRDYDGDGLPEYHHGNDSGWDNSTVFDAGFPVAAPDLSAYLVAQMDVLAALAKRLGQAKDAERWKARADGLLGRMLDRLWNGEQFVSRRAFTGDVFPKGDSLINFLPIVLGTRLPKRVRDKVAEGLKPGGRFVTKYGPATENPKSPLYVPDGYWRGPIWGPEAVIVADGLARGGYRQQAVAVARRYCDMCRRSGFAENFNALTGEPLRDKAYTWGSSAFLTLAHELLPG